jgi:cell division protein FtsB
MKRLTILGLFILLAIFQYQIWFKPNGITKTFHLKQEIAAQQQLNDQEKKHDDNLQADVASLKKSDTTVEDHARNELGMIKKGETFYQVIKK